MLKGLPAPIHGAIMALLLFVNTLFWVTPLYVLILFKLLTPSGTAPRRALDRAIAWLAQSWSMCNIMFSKVLMAVEVEVNIEPQLNPKGQYLVCCNHQTWNDIFMLMYAFGRRAPFFKFFLKQELIWVPLLGLAWWGLDYPFMKRHSRQDLAKNPALRGSDDELLAREEEMIRRQWDALGKIPCPTLVVRGAASDFLSPEIADKMVDEVLPNGQLALVAQAGHSVMSDNPEGFCQVVTDFAVSE